MSAPCAAFERVCPYAAFKRVIALMTVERILARATRERVVMPATVERIIARTTGKRIATPAAVEHIVAISAVDDVDLRIAPKRVIVIRADEVFDAYKSVALGIVPTTLARRQIDRNTGIVRALRTRIARRVTPHASVQEGLPLCHLQACHRLPNLTLSLHRQCLSETDCRPLCR